MNAIKTARAKIAKNCPLCGSIFGVYEDEINEEQYCSSCYNKLRAEEEKKLGIVGYRVVETDRYAIVTKMVEKNGGYCPCAVQKTEDTKCICKEFREQTEGTCRCGRYKKEITYFDTNHSEEKKEDFIKYDSGKLQWTLLPLKQMEDVVKVLMEGAKKYKKDNWKNCNDLDRYKDALMRHVTAYVEGEKIDKEDPLSLSHLAHAICNCLFLMYFDDKEKENDTK